MEYLNGIDDMEMQFIVPQPTMREVVQRQSRFITQNTLVVAESHADQQPCNDYDPMWPINAHPCMFPHQKGQCPTNLTLDKWISVTIQRYPRSQYARNAGFCIDMFNILQRHNVYKQSWLQLKITPTMAASLNHLTKQDVVEAMTVLSARPGLSSTSHLSWSAKKLLESLKQAGGRVPGSPQSFMKLRSKVLYYVDESIFNIHI